MTPIVITFPPEVEAVAIRLRNAPGMLNAIATEMDLQTEFTVGHIKKQKLNFPKAMPPTLAGLRHQTGHLFRSLRATKAVVRGGAVTAAIGTNVRYAGIHEFGGQTKPHVIKAKKGKALSFVMGGKKIVVRQVNHPGSKFPARAPIRTGIAERLPEITQALGGAILRYAQGRAA